MNDDFNHRGFFKIVFGSIIAVWILMFGTLVTAFVMAVIYGPKLFESIIAFLNK